MTTKARFTAADIARAVVGATKGGMIVGRVEVSPDGKIVVLSARPQSVEDPNPWDEDEGRPAVLRSDDPRR